MAAKTLLADRFNTEDGGTVQMVVYQVEAGMKYTDGVRYRLFYVRDRRVIVGYDNHYPKGHHRHVGDRQEPYAFSSMERLVADFLAEVGKSGGKRA